MRRQNGYVLISVIIVMLVLSGVSLVLNREGAMQVFLAGQQNAVSEAEMVAEAGLNHQIWQATRQGCSGYGNISTTAFGPHSYVAAISPASGSPVTVTSKSILDDGTVFNLRREEQTIYQLPQPDVELDIGISGIGNDTYANGTSGNQNNNYYTSWYMYSRNILSGAEVFPLMRFDLSSLPADIKILSARLLLRLSNITLVGSSPTLSVHRMIIDWAGNSVTYNTSDGNTSWTWPDNYLSTPDSTLVLQTSTNGNREWDLTELVDGWVQGTVPNYGFTVVADEAIDSVRIDATNNWISSQRPELIIQFTCECGMYCVLGSTLPDAIAHWKLDESSGTTAVDSEGSNDGTTSGTAWTTGQLNGAAYFDGFDDYINVPHSSELVFDEAISISAWINLEVSATGPYANQTIIGKGTTGFTEEFWLGIWENEIEFGILESGTWYGVNTIALELQPDTWYHLAVTFSDTSDEVKFYLDGNQMGAGTLTRDLNPDNKDIQIGRSQYGEYFYGELDDIRLFDFIITPEEVAALTIVAGKTPPEFDNVLDRFDAVAFNGNDGSMPWTINWQEIGESDGAGSGDVRIMNDSGRNYVLRLRDNDNGGEGVWREMNIQGCSSAKLVYEYRRSGLDNFNDYVTVSVSGDGGANWTELTRYQGNGTDTSFLSDSYDISAYIAGNTAIQLLTSPGLGGNDQVFFDNIEIRLSGCP